MARNALIAGLVCLNLALLSGIVLWTTAPRSALAQEMGQEAAQQVEQAAAAAGLGPLSNNYLMATAEIQNQFDALYLIDQSKRNLYVFVWDRGRRELELMAARDLERDFRNK